jgi:hypothetical protein
MLPAPTKGTGSDLGHIRRLSSQNKNTQWLDCCFVGPSQTRRLESLPGALTAVSQGPGQAHSGAWAKPETQARAAHPSDMEFKPAAEEGACADALRMAGHKGQGTGSLLGTDGFSSRWCLWRSEGH